MSTHVLSLIRNNPVLKGCVLTTVLLIGSAILLRYVWTRRTPLRSIVIRIGASACSIVYALTLAEVLLYLFCVQPSWNGTGLASRCWFARHWHPINSLGYRDVEHADAAVADKKVLCVLGDSFVAGHGIANVEDRFSNVLGRMLGGGWSVINVAKPGWHTRDEFSALLSLSHKPDVLILSHYVNDIEAVETRNRLVRPTRILPESPTLRRWVDWSFLCDLAYTRWNAYVHPDRDPSLSYWAHLNRCYANPEVWNAHKRQLLDIARYCDEQRIRLVVLVIPHLQAVEGSRPITSRVASAFRACRVTVVDLTDSLAGRDPAEMVVNPFDSHANESLNREIAGRLFDVIAPRHVAMSKGA